MNKNLFSLGCLLALSALTLGQTLPRTLPSVQKQGYLGPSLKWETGKRMFHVEGKDYFSVLALEQTALGPDWEAPAPLPLTLAKVEQIARVELRKLVTDEARWVVIEFEIARFHRSPNWYYAVTLKPDVEIQGVRPDSFVALVDFAGNAGRIFRSGANRAQ